MFRNSIALVLCLLVHPWLRAEFDSTRIFPSSLSIWCQVPDARVARERCSGGAFGAVFEKVLKSAQWSQILKNAKLDNHMLLTLTGLRVDEMIEALQGELAVGLFEEDGVNRWCLFLDAKSEIVAIEILRSNLEKEFVKKGYTRVEKRFGDCYTYAWSQGGECLLAYAIHEEKLLASNSSQKLDEMMNRWLTKGDDGLGSDPEFLSVRSKGYQKESSWNLFLRNQKVVMSFDFKQQQELRRRLPADPMRRLQGIQQMGSYAAWAELFSPLNVYGLLPIFQSDVTSTYASITIPAKSTGLDASLKVQINTAIGDKLFKQPGQAAFPEQSAFFGGDVVNYAVLHADFWTYNLYNSCKSFPQFAKSLEKIPNFVPPDSRSFLPVASRCLMADGSNVFIFVLRDREKFQDRSYELDPSILKKTGMDRVYSTERKTTPDGYYILTKMNFFASFAEKFPHLNPGIHYMVRGVRDGYYLSSSSEKFFTELPVIPDESLAETIPFQMVKRKLQEVSSKAIALDYWDVSRFVERSAAQFEKSRFGGSLRLISGSSFDDLFQSIAEELGPAGGAVSKNDHGFQLDYFLISRR